MGTVPMAAAGWQVLLDPRVHKLFYNAYNQLPDMIPKLYSMQKSNDSYERWSEVGELPDFTEFAGTVTYQSQNPGYDVTATHIEYTNGFQVTRSLYDDDRHGIWEKRPGALARSYMRSRQKHGARLFNNAFSVDTYFATNSEGVALCSDSHTTTSGASTAAGFDNLTTSALTATSLSASRTQFRGFRGDVAERISSVPDTLLIPIELAEVAFEIIKSAGKPDTANNNANYNQGSYDVIEWEYLTDANNYFLMNKGAMKEYLTWFDRVPLEFGMAEELDTLVAKWRAYCRYSAMFANWRWVLGGSVS